MIQEREILIIGGGPAGLAAAIEAKKLGADVLLIDENQELGGQLTKQTHTFFGAREHFAGTRGIDICSKLINEINELQVDCWNNSTAIGVFEDGIVGILHNNKLMKIKPKKIISATGAMENTLPFPGSDLPGVYGAGAVQTLMNISGVVPGKRVLMIGAGNIGLIVSYQMMQAGVEVAGIVEAMSKFGGYRVHADKVKRMQVPLYLRHTILCALGEDTVTGAILAEIDDNWKPIPGTEFKVECDTICLAVGLTPMSELLFNAKCEIQFVKELGGYVAVHDENLRTTNENIFVAGDVSGIEEASSAMVEGRIAGVNAANDLRKSDNADALLVEFKKQLDQLRKGPFGSKAREGKQHFFQVYVEDNTPVDVEPCESVMPDGKKVVVECYQNIPCNPCIEACHKGAIKFQTEDIVARPNLLPDKCGGCSICLTHCPGLALFVVDPNYSETEAEVTIPYELLPLPEKDDEVVAVGKDGKSLGSAIVTSVKTSPKFDRTSVVSFKIAKDKAMNARHFVFKDKVRDHQKEKIKPTSEELAIANEDIVICRCEDITKKEIEACMDFGYETFDELKRYLRVGMGPCQGKTCQKLIIGLLAQRHKKKFEDCLPGTYRAPMKPIQLGVLANED